MNLFDQFKPVTKAKWLDRIKTDLKGRDIKELDFQMSPSISASPFFHAEDLASAISIPYSSLGQCSLGFHIRLSHDRNDNSIIKEELEGGVNFLSIDASGKHPFDLNVVFDEIYFDMIHCHINFGDHHHKVKEFKDFLLKKYSIDILENCILSCSSRTTGFDVVTDVRDFGNIEDQLSFFLKDANSILDSIPDVRKYILQLSFGHNYLTNICLTRAARLIWSNLCEAKGFSNKTHSLITNGWIEKDAISEDQFENMIAFSQIGVGMISSGIDVLFIPPSDKNSIEGGSAKSRRISRNIFHLMTLESHLGETRDPASGSYFFDKTSSDLAELTWNNFLNENGK